MATTSERFVLHIGPRGQGGINTVIESILNTKLRQEYIFLRINTVTQKGKLVSYFKALIQCRIYRGQYKDKILIAHVHMASQGSFIRKSRIIDYFHRNNVPVVLHLHGGKFREFYQESSGKEQKKIRDTFYKVDRLIVLTNDWMPFAEQMGVKDKTSIIPNFTQIPDLSEKRHNDIMVFLFLGRLGKRKGSYDLVDAVECIIHKYSECNLKVILAGAGEVQETIDYIKNKRLDNYFSLTGWVDGDKKQELLLKSDVLVLPSYFESFGLSLIEGMSYSLPVIGTTSGSIPQVVNAGKDGFLVEAGNIEQLAEKMKWFIDNPAQAQAMGHCGRMHVISEYSEKTFDEKMNEVYTALISS